MIQPDGKPRRSSARSGQSAPTRRALLGQLLVGSVGSLLAFRGLGQPTQANRSPGSNADKLPGRPIAGGLREVGWDDLIPEDWDPAGQLPFKDVDNIADDDPRSLQLMNALRELWDKAPTRPELEGLRIRIPGYVVPLDMLGGAIREFLLVPYFGACIHTPPPPANQIIQVRLRTRRDLQTMDAIWVNGRLGLARVETGMGVSGYVLEAEAVEPYRESRGR